ncbi:hypothetical protein ACLOJK_023772 [Asimina triloba]
MSAEIPCSSSSELVDIGKPIVAKMPWLAFGHLSGWWYPISKRGGKSEGLEECLSRWKGEDKKTWQKITWVELIGRSLFLVAEREWDGSAETCHIHGLLHGFTISEGRKRNFLEIYNEVSTRTSSTTASWLAIRNETADSLNKSTPNIRSLFCFNRALKLVDVKVLKYLNLKSTLISVLPPSIDKIYNLETLLLPLNTCLPKAIWRLHQLKHLDAYNCTFEGGGSWIEEKSLTSLGGLRNLMIGWRINSQMKGIASFIGKLVNLQSLGLDDIEHSEVLLLPSLQHHLHLSESVRLERLPGLPPTLTKLLLSFSRLEEDPMPTLEMLKNLHSLSISCDSYTGRKMISSAHGFP